VNIPNFLTLFRIILTPVLVILLIDGRLFEALAVFTIAGVTDGLDGLIARWMNQKTRLGAILDPIADKLLLTSVFVTMAVLGYLPTWLAVTVISRDVIIVFGVLILFLFQGSTDISPSILSKTTTLVQLCTLFTVMVNKVMGLLDTVLVPLFVTAAVLTVVSGLHYMYLGIRLLTAVEET